MEAGLLVIECLDFGFRLVDRDEERDEVFMDNIIDQKDHPQVEKRQSAFLWRPVNPIYLEF